ncbi:hypothetical protein LXL04_002309 [Taraxacum kok-saghyz]
MDFKSIHELLIEEVSATVNRYMTRETRKRNNREKSIEMIIYLKMKIVLQVQEHWVPKVHEIPDFIFSESRSNLEPVIRMKLYIGWDTIVGKSNSIAGFPAKMLRQRYDFPENPGLISLVTMVDSVMVRPKQGLVTESNTSRYFENSYIPENPRTPKPLTFSKNRLRGAKNRSIISPVAKQNSEKTTFFFPKTLHMCKLFFCAYVHSFLFCFKTAQKHEIFLSFL